MNRLFMYYLAIKFHGSLLTEIKRTATEKLRTATMLVYIQQKMGKGGGDINLGCQGTQATKFCTMAPNIFGISK